jgi:hypothetical protein
MEQLSSLMECIDRDDVKGNIPEGTYLEMCNLLRDAVRHQPIPRVSVEHRDEYMPSSSTEQNNYEQVLSNIVIDRLFRITNENAVLDLERLRETYFDDSQILHNMMREPRGRHEYIEPIKSFISHFFQNIERFLQEHLKPSLTIKTKRHQIRHYIDDIDYIPYIPIVEGNENTPSINTHCKHCLKSILYRKIHILMGIYDLKKYMYDAYKAEKERFIPYNTFEKDVKNFTDCGKDRARQSKSSHKVNISLIDTSFGRRAVLLSVETTTPYWNLHSVSAETLSFECLYYFMIYRFFTNNQPENEYYSYNHLVWSMLMNTFRRWKCRDRMIISDYGRKITKLVHSGVGTRARKEEQRTYKTRLPEPSICYLYSSEGGKNTKKHILEPLFRKFFIEFKYIDHSKAEEPDEDATASPSNVRVA